MGAPADSLRSVRAIHTSSSEHLLTLQTYLPKLYTVVASVTIHMYNSLNQHVLEVIPRCYILENLTRILSQKAGSLARETNLIRYTN